MVRNLTHPRTSSPSAPSPEVESWLDKSNAAQEAFTALEDIQRANDLNPTDPRVQADLQHILLERLQNDPRVAFVSETDTHYVVKVRDSRPVLIPKTRETPEVFPPAERTEAERVLGMVGWIVLGFFLGGVGALVASVLVLQRALRVLRKRDLDARDRRLAWLTIILATFLGLVGEFFTLLLVLHVIG